METTRPDSKGGLCGLFVVAGVGIVVAAVYGIGQALSMFWHPPTVPECDGQPMDVYDICESRRPGGGVESTSSYSQQLGADRFGHYLYLYLTAFVILVVFCVLLGFAGRFISARKKQHQQ
ncbi:hypothetical protein [Dactylosporangium matsuzakiense]|uniref:Uncharacterized protein n=1 Tax=Dactylosporangium matsuzakiense TaxID=53360 RepID=A0A9W6NRU0_9ACTN|nr:hypothetical protein [Dactylosporangium matsuzakiense]UWZ47797.1 hypothetical protein Dmats_16170 [Dactylosporangium matsuzakiense]GLL07660.1 hypothetical protein GCM10017581_094140 [Dactylosporangium matsuzakiense]